jgi:RimJ/RimL family protein N-acetyltransferase
MFDPSLEIETPRLLLRRWRPADRVPFAAINADARVMACFPACLSRAQSDDLAQRCEAFIARHGWGLWAIELRATGAFIGFTGLNVPSVPLPFGPCVEVGWRLAFEYWGRGLATEAAQRALQVGFGALALDEIVSFTAVDNRRSRAVMERLGMRYDSEFDHPGLPPDSALRRHCLYRLARHQYAPGPSGAAPPPRHARP